MSEKVNQDVEKIDENKEFDKYNEVFKKYGRKRKEAIKEIVNSIRTEIKNELGKNRDKGGRDKGGVEESAE